MKVFSHAPGAGSRCTTNVARVVAAACWVTGTWGCGSSASDQGAARDRDESTAPTVEPSVDPVPSATGPVATASPVESAAPTVTATPGPSPTMARTPDEEILDDPGPAGCERKLEISTVTVKAPEPFDVIIVADHSGSLSWSRDDLAKGLQDFLGRVRGYDVRFFVLTPTQYGASSEESESPINGRYQVAWQDPATMEAYTHEMTSYSETCIDATGTELPCPKFPETFDVDFTLHGRWDFVLPEPVATITPEMDGASIDAERQLIADAILGLGLGGASDEQPICTLNRYMTQAAEELPEHAVFLILSDEDDTSDPERCLSDLEIDVTLNGDARVFEMRGSGPRAQRRFNCTPVDDQGNVSGDPVPHLWNLEGCTESHACSASDEQAAIAQCPVDHVMSDCIISCQETTWVACRVDETEVSADACNGPFSLGGASYTNLLDYCQRKYPTAESWASCTNYEKDGARLQNITTLPLLPGMTLEQMGSHFRERADAAFGASGYSVELIAFEPEFECAPQAGQSYAEQLARLVDSTAHVFPICEDYADALEQAERFAGDLIPDEYPLELAEGEELSAIRIVAADGTARDLDPDTYAYDAEGGVVHFTPGALGATDSTIEADVLGACVAR